MTLLSVTRNYVDGAVLTQAHLDTAFNSIETVVNGQLDTANNIDFNGSIYFAKNGNDYLTFDDTNDYLNLYVDGTAVFRIEEAPTSMTIKNLISDADMRFNVNDGGVDTTVLTLVGADVSASFAGKLTVNGDLIITSPHITTGIQDANGNNMIDFVATTSAVNNVTITNATTGNAPRISASGSDADVPLELAGKGNQPVQMANAAVGKVITLVDAPNIATNASRGHIFEVTLGGNRTLDNPTNPTSGQKVEWRIKQDATGGRTITLGSAFRFGTDITSITLTTTANKQDKLICEYVAADAKWDVIGFIKGF